MIKSIRIGVSACLLGEKVRYDGGHRLDSNITVVLGRNFVFVPVCPEVECGMSVPREKMQLEGDLIKPRLMTVESRIDKTEEMTLFCRAWVGEFEKEELCGFILKSKSPSCGLSGICIHNGAIPAGTGRGLFAAALVERFPLLPVEDERGMADPQAREKFIKRVFGYHNHLRGGPIMYGKELNTREECQLQDLKGTKTEGNLKSAFAGESQARNKYTYFASVAKKEGYEKIAAIFLETADNEREHAKLHLKRLSGIGSTVDNLRAAAAGEMDEYLDMYPRMAREAREEGFNEIAFLFESIGNIEKAHQERYRKLLEELEEGSFFKKDDAVRWRCRNCGHIHEGPEAPETCPVCSHAQAYFELVEGL